MSSASSAVPTPFWFYRAGIKDLGNGMRCLLLRAHAREDAKPGAILETCMTAFQHALEGVAKLVGLDMAAFIAQVETDPDAAYATLDAAAQKAPGVILLLDFSGIPSMPRCWIETAFDHEKGMQLRHYGLLMIACNWTEPFEFPFGLRVKPAFRMLARFGEEDTLWDGGYLPGILLNENGKPLAPPKNIREAPPGRGICGTTGLPFPTDDEMRKFWADFDGDDEPRPPWASDDETWRG